MRVVNRAAVRSVALAAVLALVVPLSGAAATAGPGGRAAASVRTTAQSTTSVGTTVKTMSVGSQVTFSGHGWGHGRGMGQYGALGYAVNGGWSYSQILQHFYGNTTVGSVANQMIDVELVTPSSRTWTIVAGNNLRVNGADIGATGLDVALIERSGTSYTVKLGSGCEGPWSGVVATYTGSLELSVPTQTGYENLIRSCEAGNLMRAYRGSMVVTAFPGSATNQLVMNRVSLEEYLLGVVPRESLDSWGAAGSGKGLQALKAQAVAARSYAMAGSRPSGAKTCDTTSCQVYGGAAEANWNGSAYVVTKTLDGTYTTPAVQQTAGEVRLLSGAVARTEFSSSTGGYTVASANSPAVVDDGDAVASNPNHNWTATFSSAAVAASLGISGLQSITVTQRNGLGDWGGRVLQVVAVDGAGASHSFTGATFRTLMGTSTFKSDWFTVGSNVEAQNVVRALYADVLGRAVDPDGLNTWTSYIERTGDSAGLVRLIATSRERMENLVTAQYALALNRTPEPQGLDFWVHHLEAGRGVYDLQVGIFGSPEALIKLGGGDVNTWVGALYERILGRTAGASERAYWTDIAARQGREAVVVAIARSDEATMRRLEVYYQTFLLRSVDPAGRATFLPLMTGRGDFTIPVALGSSPEYWARAQTRALG